MCRSKEDVIYEGEVSLANLLYIMDQAYSSGQQALLKAVKSGTYKDVNEAFQASYFKQNGNQFDCALLVAALERRHQSITNFLFKNECGLRRDDQTDSEDTPLCWALKSKDVGMIKKLIRKGAYSKTDPYNDNSPLYVSVRRGNYGVVDVILSVCDFTEANPENTSDLIHFHAACLTSKLKIIKTFVDRGFCVNSCSDLGVDRWKGCTPLHFAAVNSCKPTFTFLLKQNADLAAQDSEGSTALHLASDVFLYEIHSALKRLHLTELRNSTDNKGLSIFHICCSRDLTNLVKMFLDNGVDVNSSTNSDSEYPGYTGLHFAVSGLGINTVKLLLKHGPNVNKSDKKGSTPLHLACKLVSVRPEVRFQVVESLLKQGADVNLKDNEDRTPLHYAFYVGDKETINFLLERTSMDTISPDSRGLTYLHIACTRNDVKRVKAFLENGASANLRVDSDGKDYCGYSPLHFAVEFHIKSVVRLLLKYGADANVIVEDSKNVVLEDTAFLDRIDARLNVMKKGPLYSKANYVKKSKLTPLHFACRQNHRKFSQLVDMMEVEDADIDWTSYSRNHSEITELLLNHGADVDAKDSSGKPLLFLACEFDISQIKQDLYEGRRSYNRLPYDFEYNVQNAVRKARNGIIATLLRCDGLTDTCAALLLTICERRSLLQSDVDFIEFLLKNGADVNAVNAVGKTPLHLAVEHSQAALVAVLLNRGANIEAKTTTILLTPLHIAASQSSPSYSSRSVIQTLLRRGSDVHARSLIDETPLHKAFYNHSIHAATLLLGHGADINSVDHRGRPTIYSFYDAQVNPRYFYPPPAESLILQMLEVIETHVKKLAALNVHVTEENKKYLRQVYLHCKKEEFNELDDISIRCTEEVERLKSIKIDRYTSLCDILRKDQGEVANHTKNENLRSIVMADDFADEFPLYNDLLRVQYDRGLARRAVQEPAKISLDFITGLSLPESCSEQILKYLSNKVIDQLIKAKTIDCNKRELDVKNDESSVKRQRLR